MARKPKQRARRRSKPRARVDVFASLNALAFDPNDPIAMNRQIHSVIAQTIALVAKTPALSRAELQRVSLISNLARSAVALTPQATIGAGLAAMRDEHAGLKTGDHGPRLEPSVGHAAGSIAISARDGGSAPRRGRPRKRAMV